MPQAPANHEGHENGARPHVAVTALRFGSRFLRGFYGGPRGVPAAPTVLLLGISSKCNLRCDFCFHAGTDIPSESRRPQGMMSDERFASIIEQARGWCAYLSFGLFGEPMLHPHFLDMVKLAVEAGFTVAIDTNGTLLTPERASELVRIGPASVTISMEGATPADYDRLRVGAHWERVASNVRALVAARRAAGRRCPLIAVRGIALEGQALHRRAHAALYRDLGVDQVMWVPARNWSGSLRAPQGSVRIPSPPPRTQGCTFPRFVLAVDWDGTVLPCCEDFNAKNALGNVDETPLREVWTGANVVALRDALATRERDHIEACTGCAGCSHLSQPEAGWDYKLQLARFMFGQFWARYGDERRPGRRPAESLQG